MRNLGESRPAVVYLFYPPRTISVRFIRADNFRRSKNGFLPQRSALAKPEWHTVTHGPRNG
jgi:hypothetical protein